MINKEITGNYNSSEFEDELYKWWEENGYFTPEKQEELGIIDDNSETFCNTIPPPNVTGVLHLGHAITIALQDLMTRYARMNGKRTVFVPGTDHAGIATQNVVERELDKKGIKRKEIGRAKFLENVWAWKEKSHETITNQSKKMGMSADWNREAFTMDDNLSRAVREAFVSMYEKGLIYRGDYLINWCPGRCESAVSDLESEPIDTEGHLWYIKYPITSKNWKKPRNEWGSGNWAKGAEKFITVATTRPETLLGDAAIATSSKHKEFGKLIGKTAILPVLGRKIKIIEDEAVDAEFGTGALKITPAHDFNDYEAGKRHDLEFYSIFDEKAVLLTEFGGKYAGMDRFDARDAIVDDLKKEGLLVKIEDHNHTVPHCQRCKTVIEPRNSVQWFVKTKPLVENVIKKIEEDGVNFVPSNMIDRLYQWLNPDTIRDWCISRQLWWGHRIPVWHCQDCQEMTTGRTDPNICEKCGSTNIKQDPDVLDTWFSSGLWPFSTLGWPEKTDDLDKFYPNTIRETGYDILFFWIARELMMGVELTGKLPYENIYLHGLIRNEEGKKISKSMENIEDYNPLKIIEKYGADTLRFTLVAYSAAGLDMNLDFKNIESTHKFGNKIWNGTKFVLMNIPDDFKYIPPAEFDLNAMGIADRWILSQTHRLIGDITNYNNEYNFLEAARELRRFFWNIFAAWYIEITKNRLYDESSDSTLQENILIHVLDTFMRLLHPIMPSITERIWQTLPKGIRDQEALIVARWPKVDDRFLDSDLDKKFSMVIDIITAIRGIRGEFVVPNNQKIEVMIAAGNNISTLEESSDTIKQLAGVGDLIIQNSINTEVKVISAVVGDITIYIPLEGLVEIEDEIKRINKEIDKIDKLIKKAEGKLKSDFVDRAPLEIVLAEKEKLTSYKEKREKFEERLKLLQ